MENENWNLDDILNEWLPEAEPAEEPIYEEELPAEEPAMEFAEETLPEETAGEYYEELSTEAPVTEFGEEPIPETDYYAAETEEPEAELVEDAFTERQAALLGEEPGAPKKKREKKVKEPKAEGEKWRRAPKDIYYDDPKPARKKKKGGLWALIIIAAVLVLLAAAVVFGCSKVQQVQTIYPGVSVEGIDFSNRTAEEVAAELTKLGHERYDYYTVDVDLPLDNHMTLTTDDVGLTFSVRDAALKAWHFGRDEGFFGNALQYVQNRYLGKTAVLEDTGIEVTMDETALRGLIQTSAVDIDAQLLENSVVITDSTIELIKGASGMTIDEEMLFSMIRDAFLNPTEETLVYESEPVLDEEFDFQGLYDEHYSELVEGQLAYNPACLNKAGAEEQLDEATEAAKAAAEAQEAAIAAANAGDGGDETAAEPQGESFADQCYALGATITDWEEGEKYRVLPSSEGWSFDVAEAERLWAAAGYGDTVVIPLTVEKPVNSSEDLTNMLFADALSKNWTMYRFGFTDGYTEDIRTSLAGSTTNRINNVKKACDLINDIILMPGEVFEYNATLGQRTEEAGWLPAPAYANGEVRQEAGGGICQVSSTLYNAALYSNLEIVERECHQFKVAYLPWGLDATVSWGWPDFKFRNDKDYPIKIKAWVDEETNYCCFQILGTDVEHQYVIMQFNNWYFYDTTGEYHDANGDPLSIGMEAATWRLVYNDGDDYKTAEPISNTYEAHSKYNDHSEDIEARNVPLS